MMRQLEAMSAELRIALWVATQGNRESMNGELITLGKAGGSFKKIQIAHIVVTISRTPEDITNNVATLAILKNRAGQTSPPIENAEFNNGTCIISTDNTQIYNNWNEYKETEIERERDDIKQLMEERRKRTKTT
jgi:hypothetical protein